MMKTPNMRTLLCAFATCALATFSVLAGCSFERAAEKGVHDEAPAAIVRLAEHEYVDDHAGRGVLIDVRTPDEYADGHLVDARNINVLDEQFRDRVEGLDRDSTYYLYCRSGNRSGRAAETMAAMGFRSIYNIGAFEGLAEAGADTLR